VSETLFAIIDGSGAVVNVIVAEQEFVDSLPDLIADDGVDTGDLTSAHKFVDVTDKDPQPGIGWTRAANGKFVAPAVPEPTQAELDARAAAEAAAEARAADDEFLAGLQTKVAAAESLTQDERDRMTLISLTRGG
jgi:hypothetical protein